MAQARFQTASLKPLTGVFDCRSNVDETPAGAFRWKENFAINPDGKLSRALGWVRPYENPCYKNWDFHNQGESVAVEDREPTTLLFQSQANDGTRRLFLGTKTRLLQLDETAGEYVELKSGLGADGDESLTQVRFNASELQNKILFTNDFDIPHYHELGTTTAQEIPALATAAEDGGAITKARRTVAWQGVVFLMNTVESGVRYSSRIRWCDLNNMLRWKPDEEGGVGEAKSIADYQDLDYGEVILNAMPMSGALYVFTDRSIWKCTFSVDVGDPDNPQAVLNCVKVYTEPRNRAKCLAYENSLISTGFSFYYFSTDGIYEYSPFLSEPDRVEWLHRSTAVIFKDAATRIDKQACASPVAEYVPGPNENETAGCGEIHFSWPVYDPLAVEVPGEPVPCEEYVPLPPVVGSGINRHTLVVNVKFKTADYRNYGATAMTNFTSTVLASTGCNRQSILFASIGSDFCLKQMDTGTSRIVYNAETDTYTTAGYYSLARGVFPFERFDMEKVIKSFLVGIIADNSQEAAVLRCRIGTSFEALDPNKTSGNCGVLWHQLSDKRFNCRNTKTATQYVAANVRPDDPVEWNFFYKGRFLYYEIRIAKADGSAPTTGACQISRFEVAVKQGN